MVVTGKDPQRADEKIEEFHKTPCCSKQISNCFGESLFMRTLFTRNCSDKRLKFPLFILVYLVHCWLCCGLIAGIQLLQQQ